MLGVDAESDALDILPIDAPDPDRRAGSESGRRLPRRWLVAGGAALAAIGVLVMVFLSGGEPSDEGADPDTTATEETDFGGLIDGQTIRLEVDGLPESVGTVTVQCVVAGTRPADVCDPTTAQRSSTSPDGTLAADVAVWRVISTGEFGTYDCAQEACEVRTFPPQTTGSVASSSLGFDPQNSAALPPEIYTSQALPTSEDTINLRSSALAEGTRLTVTGCTMGVGRDPIACGSIWEEVITVGGGGLSFEIDTILWQGNIETHCHAGCRIDFNIDGLDRQPFSIHLPISDRAGLLVDTGVEEIPTTITVTPSTDLLDGQEVTVEADGFGTDMELYLCADTVQFDCSWLARSVTEGEMTVRVPRAFISWQGGLRDCAEIACEIVILGPMNFENRVSASVSFDGSEPLDPGRPLSIKTDGPIADGATLELSIDPNEGAMEWPNMAVCAVDRAETCEYVDQNLTDDAVTVTLHRHLATPTGPYDCVDDGPCQLFVWIDGRQSRFEPLLLEFDPDAPLAREPATVTIRPAGPLSDGQPISVTVRGLHVDDYVVFASICVVNDTRCAFLGGIEGPSGSSTTFDLRIRRIVSMPSVFTPGAAAVVDCFEVQCEIRLGNVRSGDPAPLVFKDEPPLPDPQVAIDVVGPVPTNEIVEIRGRDFTFISLHDELWLDVHLCQLDETGAGYGSCHSVGAISADGVDEANGSFRGTIIIPENPPALRLGNLNPCDVDCVLVVYDGAGPPGILPVTVDR